jgi:hypothetical protein
MGLSAVAELGGDGKKKGGLGRGGGEKGGKGGGEKDGGEKGGKGGGVGGKKWDYEAELLEQAKLVRKKMLNNIFLNLAGFNIMKQKKRVIKRVDRHWKKLARSKSHEILFGTGRTCQKLERTKLLFPNWKHRMTKRFRNIIYKVVTHKDEQDTSPT